MGKGTDVFFPDKNECLTVDYLEEVNGEPYVHVVGHQYRNDRREKRRASKIRRDKVCVVPVKHASRQDPMVDHEAVIVRSNALNWKDLIGRKVIVDKEMDTKVRVYYYENGKEVSLVVQKARLHGLGCTAERRRQKYIQATSLPADGNMIDSIQDGVIRRLVELTVGIDGSCHSIVHRWGRTSHTGRGLAPPVVQTAAERGREAAGSTSVTRP